jgi:hypothetical protein
MISARVAHRKKRRQSQGLRRFFNGVAEKATRKKHQANVSAQMFCAQLQA